VIAILLTKATTREELRADWERWVVAFGKPPDAVLGHVELPMAFPEQRNEETRYEGVPVLTLDEFINLHAEDIDPDEDDEDDWPDEDEEYGE
jgi:hypothetical protein